MKKSAFLIILLLIPISIGMYSALASNISMQVVEKTDTTLNSSKLADVIKYLDIGFEPYDLTYLDGYLWVVDDTINQICKINPSDGSIVLNISLNFKPYGLTNNGTNLFVSVFQAYNTTIYILAKNGTILSSFVLPLTSSYAFFIRGLAWLDDYLWVSQSYYNVILKVNPNTGIILKNITAGKNVAGITAYKGYIWCSSRDEGNIAAYDTTTGRIMETFKFTATTPHGLTHNGTNFFLGNYQNTTISIFDNPTKVGEVYNTFNLPTGAPGDITWNGTHYFLAGYTTTTIYIIHDGTYQLEDTIPLTYQPLAITKMGNYLLVSEFNSPYRIHQIKISDGSEIASFAALGSEEIDGLAYDGTNVWAVFDDGANTYLGRLNSTFEVEVRFPIEDAGGITYDYENGKLWVVSWSTKKLIQFDLTGTATGLTFASPQTKPTNPTSQKEWGITFNGEHLVVADQLDDVAFKVIISSSSSSGVPPPLIPGFELLFVLSSIVILVGLVFIARKFKAGNQKNLIKNIF